MLPFLQLNSKEPFLALLQITLLFKTGAVFFNDILLSLDTCSYTFTTLNHLLHLQSYQAQSYLGLYCCAKTPWSKATWRGKGLFGTCKCPSHNTSWRDLKAETRTCKIPVEWLAPHVCSAFLLRAPRNRLPITPLYSCSLEILHLQTASRELELKLCLSQVLKLPRRQRGFAELWSQHPKA